MQERHKIELQTQIEAKEAALEQAKIAIGKVSLEEAKKAGIVVKKENVEVQEDDGVERAFMVEGVQTEDSVKLMLDQGFETTKDGIEKIRKDIEIDRLKLLDERTELEIKEANLKREEELFEQKKEEHPELVGAAVGLAAGTLAGGAGEQGMELIIEEEIKRRLKEEKDKQEYEENAKSQVGTDLEVKALETFVELRARTTVNLDNVTDDDTLADAMKAAETLR